MKQVRTLLPVLLGAGAIAAAWTIAVAGDVNPPSGPVAPTFKTLAQVEPRIPVDSSTTPGNSTCLFRITEPGSYYLTGNVLGVAGKSAIQISASNVTLDLNGFTIDGGDVGFRGVVAPVGSTGVVIRGGTVTGWTDDGVSCLSSASVVENVVSRANAGDGIATGASCVVRDVVAANNAGAGINAGAANLIVGCVASQNGADGVLTGSRAEIVDSEAEDNAGSGFRPGMRSLVSRCFAGQNNQVGIRLVAESRVHDCGAFDNDHAGIAAGAHCSILNNSCGANRGDGNIFVTGPGNRVERNQVTEGTVGIRVIGLRNIIAGNTASDAGANYSIVSGNLVGTILGVGTGNLNTSNAYANFDL